MTKKLKKVLALLLTLSMVMSMVTVGAMAEEDTIDQNQQIEATTDAPTDDLAGDPIGNPEADPTGEPTEEPTSEPTEEPTNETSNELDAGIMTADESEGDSPVWERNPSVLTTDIGGKAFVVGEAMEFTFTSQANDDIGTMVLATFDFSDADAVEKLEYYETAEAYEGWHEFPGTTFGPTDGFPMGDATSRFRATFKTAGTYTYTVSVKAVEGNRELCSTSATITVSEPVVEEHFVAQIGDTGYATLQDAINAAESGTVTLLESVTENVTVNGKTITLDLGGKTLTGTGNGTVLTINGGNVTLDGNGIITGGHSTYYTQGGGVTVTGGAAFLMKSGTITGNIANQYGSGVMVYSGTFTMAGGSITGNGPSDVGGTGGGVCVYNCIEDQTAQFIMSDGTISGNEAGIGGGVGAFHWRLSADRTSVIINGGTITGNTATNGGGVSVSTADSGGTEFRGKIEINGGTISGNTANLGGGVYSTESIAAISGGKIIGNTAEGVSGFGGGVYVQAGSATLTGAEITGNTAKTGGGVFAGHNQRETTVTMTSGKLYGNAANQAADVYCNVLTTLTLPDAASMGGTLNDEPITDWFWDGGGQYAWSKDYLLKRNVSGTKVQQYLIAAYEIVPVAKIVRNGEDVLFYTLQDAINTAEDGETVEVLKNTIGASLQNAAKKVTVNIPEGVTVNTNTGKTYALAVAGAGAELTITGEGAIQGSTYGVVAQSGGTANIIGGIINGERAVLGLNSATINVTDESVSIDGTYAGIHAQGADVNVLVNAGEVKGGTFGMFLSKGASATVEGTARLSRTKDDNTGFTISLKGPGGDDDTVQHTSLVVNGGTITNTKNAAIGGNGSVTGTADARHTTITINGGIITSTESWGIYHPQQGEMNITGGTITGITGIEMRAGTLNVSGNAVITGTNTEYKHDPNANGATTMGVGIAISQHVTERPITAVISGGTITGYHAVVEHDLQNNPQSEHVSLTITGGLFTATGVDNVTVISDNFEKFITGGYFSDDLDAENTETAKYVADPYASHPVSSHEGYFNVHRPDFYGENEYGFDVTDHWQGCKVDKCLEGKVVEPHTFGDWIVDVAAQVGVAGSQHHNCTACGYREDETIPALPQPSNPDPTIIYYTLTINYVDGEGNAVTDTYTRDLREGRSYSVTSPAVEGMTPNQATVSGVLNGNTTITVTYAENVEEPDTPTTESPDSTESPEESEDLGENDTPLTDGPETSEPPVEPTETPEPTEPQNPDETEDLGENDTPLADVPQTGDFLWVWLTLALLSAAGLVWVSLTEKKGKRVA